jgi:hypothetical protein
MELPAGVFVADASTEVWEPDPEVPGSEMRELVRADGVWAGLTRFTRVDGPVPWTARAPGDRRDPGRVGADRDRDRRGRGAGVGDLFSLPPGVETTWQVTTPFREAWVLAD